MADGFDGRGAALLDEPVRAASPGVDLAELLALPADPLAWLNADVLFDIDRRDPAEPVDIHDLDAHDPFVLEAEHEYAGVAASVDAFAELCASLDAAEQAQFAVNRAMAEHLAAVRRALEVAARNPAVYLLPAEIGKPGASELAVRAAAAELSMRLHVPAGTIRNRAHEAAVLQDRLPETWARFTDGAVTYTDARVAADTAAGFPPGDARLPELDHALAAVIGTVTTSQLRHRARTIRARLERDALPERHARALAERRVVTEYVDDGMGWLHLYASQVEIAKITTRLDNTARRDHGHPDEPRTLEQLRADAATAWLTGAGTPTAARTELLVTIPVLSLVEAPGGRWRNRADHRDSGAKPTATHRNSTEGTATHRNSTHRNSTDRDSTGHDRRRYGEAANDGIDARRTSLRALESDEQLAPAPVHRQLPMLDGVGPIDEHTARRLFSDAHSFLRLAVDPITAAPLALDRTRYRVTKEQRIWLALTHGTCSRPGCNRLAYTADIDHLDEWQHDGGTDPENLCPDCRGDHRLKHTTRLTPTKNPDDTVTWRSPTGREYTGPPPF